MTMLYHHDGRNYIEAATEAANRARTKLLEQIEQGQQTVAAALHQIDNEVPVDALVPLNKMTVLPPAQGEERAVLALPDNSVRKLTRWSQDQLSERVGAPARFVRELMTHGQERQQIATDLLTRLAALMPERALVRNVGDQVRGVLSDRFRRIDVRPTMSAFIEEAVNLGAVPLRASMTETRTHLRMVLPHVFEPAPNEIISIGGALTNSDVGNGALAFSLFIDRLWCTNFAIMHSEMRAVHLGRRLTEEEFRFSEMTMKLDSQTQVSAVRDVVRAALAPERVGEILNQIVKANAAPMTSGQITGFLKSALNTGGQVAEAEAKFSSAEMELLPPGQTVWRLSNVLSLLAQSNPDPEARLDYERAAGKALMLAAA